MLLPSAVHVSSVIKRGASGDWDICSSVVFRIGSFEFGAMFHDFLSADPRGNPPFSLFFGAP